MTTLGWIVLVVSIAIGVWGWVEAYVNWHGGVKSCVKLMGERNAAWEKLKELGHTEYGKALEDFHNSVREKS